MGLMPTDQGTVFRKLDSRAVVGMFKSTGARDPDMLHAERQRLMAQPKQLKLLAMIMIVIGGFFTVTVILAIAGIPFVLFGIWMWFFSKKQLAAIESGYAEYVASIGVS